MAMTVLLGCSDDADSDASHEMVVGPADILANPEHFAGRVVALHVELDETLTDRAFTVSSIESGELLVIHDGSYSPVGDSSISVTGTIERSVQGPVLRDMIDQGIPSSRVDRFLGEPYMSASRIDPDPPGG